MAALCSRTGRIDDAVGYVEAGQTAVTADVRGSPVEFEAPMGGGYIRNQAERGVEWCRDVIARRPDAFASPGVLGLALKFAGAEDEAMAASEDFLPPRTRPTTPTWLRGAVRVRTAHATPNPPSPTRHFAGA